MDKRIGAQLYTLRDFCKNTEQFKETLEKVSKIGYKTIQISGVDSSISAKEIRETADLYNLEIICTHSDVEDMYNNLPKIIEDHKTMGCNIVGIGNMPREFSADRDKLFDFIKKTSEVSEELKKHGMIFSYHNHAFEFTKMDGKFVFDIILENTPADCYKFLLDVYWVAIGGVDPASWLMHCKDRLSSVHFKDLRIPGGENSPQYAEVLEGNLNWDSIFDACEKANAPYAFVEQDSCYGRDPFTCMETSYKNLTKKGFI